jgi:osmotically-inducible protein OsmY
MTQNERSNLQHDVIAELEWDPSIDASRIGVAVEDGVVTLTGHVSSYAEKAAADRVVKRVHGVEGVANDIEVQLPTGDRRDDAEIARTAVEALRWNAAVPEGNIKVSVSK